ncbi:NAD(P)-dependent oxidoreductase [Streptosporangium carneum]|uniref:2-hydroxyacid dehydrogenase n=1 Tax=Streptosporangium carneum TaxID=47481 RepID=A0A9W6IC48_9ACTN|nr:NAD(P)-dependent oxidoreductase [Streptosporangium carneum]GLK14765.1 2-hydroxyacid dehydrogenase [Streptosporangium carneum]
MSDKLRVLVASPLEPEHVEAIEAADRRLEVLYEPDLLPRPRYPADHTGVRPELPEPELKRWRDLLARAQVSFDFDWWDPAGMPVNCPDLRWVQATSAGIGQFVRRTRLSDSDLVLTTAAGVHAVPLAEFALTGVLHFVKGLPELRRWQAARHWERYTTRGLAGRRVVVVGLGGIGRQVVRVFSALGVEVVGVGRPGRAYDVPGLTELHPFTAIDAALAGADALVLACPLTDETEGLIGAGQLAALAPGAVLVNIARGQVVDEGALVDALAARHLGGACLDVFSTEPLPTGSPLWGMDNVIVSPHSASTVDSENGTITELFTDNLRRWLDGRPLRNLFDRERGY